MVVYGVPLVQCSACGNRSENVCVCVCVQGGRNRGFSGGGSHAASRPCRREEQHPIKRRGGRISQRLFRVYSWDPRKPFRRHAGRNCVLTVPVHLVVSKLPLVLVAVVLVDAYTVPDLLHRDRLLGGGGTLLWGIQRLFLILSICECRARSATIWNLACSLQPPSPPPKARSCPLPLQCRTGGLTNLSSDQIGDGAKGERNLMGIRTIHSTSRPHEAA